MSNIVDPNTKFNKIFMFIGNTVTIITACLSLISWIIKEILKGFSSLPSICVIIITYLLHFSIVLFIIGLICSLIRIIYTGIKCKSESYYIQRKLTEFIHQKLIHKVRNDIVELEPLSEKIKRLSSENNKEAISECYKNEVKILEENLKGYIDELSEYLSKYRHSTISVCIKTFKNRVRNRDEYLSEEIISLARSTNTEQERKNNSKTMVGQNTDFTNLCRGKIVFFGSSNLQKIKESGQYINDSINYEDNRYVSTLVTPIRYYNIGTNDNNNRNVKPDIIGFLCIDSEDEIKEWEHEDSFELQILATFSDILYVYIKDFYQCFENTEYNLN